MYEVWTLIHCFLLCWLSFYKKHETLKNVWEQWQKLVQRLSLMLTYDFLLESVACILIELYQ